TSLCLGASLTTAVTSNRGLITCLLHRYILSIESAEEIEEYVGDLIQGTDGKKRQFIDELLERWQRSRQRAPESVQLYRRNEEMDTEVSETMRGCDALKKSKRKGRNKQETMIYTEQAPGPDEVKTPIDLAKKKKFVSLYAKEGQDKLAILLPGRHPCECLAQKHRLINNCLTCGRIVCEQEGSGPCLFCGSLVCTKEEQEILQRDSNKSQKLRKKLMAGRSVFPETCEESASPFVFICSNPQELVVKFPMKGKHKICKSCFLFIVLRCILAGVALLVLCKAAQESKLP
ncbi:Activating signal cointegrator 1, partial [Acipenser ruthenus]